MGTEPVRGASVYCARVSVIAVHPCGAASISGYVAEANLAFIAWVAVSGYFCAYILIAYIIFAWNC